jgi:hypothetical protein
VRTGRYGYQPFVGTNRAGIVDALASTQRRTAVRWRDRLNACPTGLRDL